MDAFWKILLFIVFAFIFIVKKKADSKRAEENDAPKPVFNPPTWMTSEEIEEPAYQEEEYVSMEKQPMTLKEELEATRSKTNVVKKYENTMEDVHSTSNVAVNDPVIEDLDLRKAVIYSEILKTKFDE